MTVCSEGAKDRNDVCGTLGFTLMLSASGHDHSEANILYSPHYGRFNRSAFALYSLQFHADGRKIAL